MAKTILESILDARLFEELPQIWSSLDTKQFSQSKQLYHFQEEAVRNAIKCLYSYYVEHNQNKTDFYRQYVNNGLEDSVGNGLHLSIRNFKGKKIKLDQYYATEEGLIHFQNFINRAAFWMATASGKTLVIVKIIEILKRLMDAKAIPRKDIVVLTHREDLIQQFKEHVDEFNELSTDRGFKINLRSLLEYEDVKRASLVPYLDELTVFYYRSDLISDEQKENEVDFRNYDNDGNWYAILDEAHKGVKEDSKRQMYYSILTRNGFLFNFSASFVDESDIVTTAFNFNLEKFITGGFGKHLCLLKHEATAFREANDDYNEEEKEKIVLQSLLLLTFVKQQYKDVKAVRADAYHEPLLLTLVNTVNLTDLGEQPDLKLFFNQIEKIAKGVIDQRVFEESKAELLQEFADPPLLIYEKEKLFLDRRKLERISISDVLREVFNSDAFGGIEAIIIPQRNKEAVFKMKTSDKPFALIRIGDAAKWIRENMKGYEVNETYEDESIFEQIDERNEISLLMGSRSFYEGWDSNRPNVLLFINIGTGTDARKFVIQSIGRGVRIEPLKNRRNRLLTLYNKREDEELFEKIRHLILPVETLFIFGTNRAALDHVVQGLKVERDVDTTIELELNTAKADMLLIPIFKQSDKRVYKERDPLKFLVTPEALKSISNFLNTVDDRILVMLYDIEPDVLDFLKKSFKERSRYFRASKDDETSLTRLDRIIPSIITHFNTYSEQLDKFKKLENEIVHFKMIRVSLDNEQELRDLKERISNVTRFVNPDLAKNILKRRFQNGDISLEDYTAEIEKLSRTKREETFKELVIRNVANHYYVPLILSTDDKVNYIKHIVKVPSEIDFLNKLEAYTREASKLNCDWWLFSKVDEHVDDIRIPYYDPGFNTMRNFKPDFIFWMKKGERYQITFVDPKGISHTQFQHKVDWFERFFGTKGEPKTFQTNGVDVNVSLYMVTSDINRLSKRYREYWFDNPAAIFEDVKFSS